MRQICVPVIIVISAFLAPALAQHLQAGGAYAVLAKPFLIEALIAAMRNGLSLGTQ